MVDEEKSTSVDDYEDKIEDLYRLTRRRGEEEMEWEKEEGTNKRKKKCKNKNRKGRVGSDRLGRTG